MHPTGLVGVVEGFDGSEGAVAYVLGQCPQLAVELGLDGRDLPHGVMQVADLPAAGQDHAGELPARIVAVQGREGAIVQYPVDPLHLTAGVVAVGGGGAGIAYPGQAANAVAGRGLVIEVVHVIAVIQLVFDAIAQCVADADQAVRTIVVVVQLCPVGPGQRREVAAGIVGHGWWWLRPWCG